MSKKKEKPSWQEQLINVCGKYDDGGFGAEETDYTLKDAMKYFTILYKLGALNLDIITCSSAKFKMPEETIKQIDIYKFLCCENFMKPFYIKVSKNNTITLNW